MDRLIEIEKEINSSDEIEELLQLTNITMRSWIFSSNSVNCLNYLPYIRFYFYTPGHVAYDYAVNCGDEREGKKRIMQYLLNRYIIYY